MSVFCRGFSVCYYEAVFGSQLVFVMFLSPFVVVGAIGCCAGLCNVLIVLSCLVILCRRRRCTGSDHCVVGFLVLYTIIVVGYAWLGFFFWTLFSLSAPKW